MMNSTNPRPRRFPGKSARIALAATLAGVLLFAVCEFAGWPFLAAPTQRLLSRQLDRAVSFDDEASVGGSSGFSLSLLHPRLRLSHLQIANAPGIELGPMLVAQEFELQMRWSQLLQWRPGQALQLQSLSAESLALRLQRRADGRASWQFGVDTATTAASTTPAPPLNEAVRIEELQLRRGTLRLVDEPQQLDLAARWAEDEKATLHASAEGSLRQQPLRAALVTATAPRWLSSDTATPAVPLALRLSVGRAQLRFDGQVQRPLGVAREVQGRFHIAGPSLAAVGEPLHLTLPQTRRFAMDGLIQHGGHQWHAVVEQATVGSSRLDGAFTFDNTPGRQPLLAGRLHGSALLMQDLGPAVGGATEDAPKTTRGAGRVLPDRTFDLPSLRAMNANVLVDIARFDFGTPLLQAAAPLRAQLLLQDGQLGIENLDAGLAQGRLSGHVRLDGRAELARWDIDLRGQGLVMEQWIKPVQRAQGPPYATGLLGGRVALTGVGRSTAELLGSADGRVQAYWTRGTVSHLLVEAAGLDIAQALGVALRGDDALPVLCGAADLAVKAGRMTPSVLLVDTRDSTIWVDGNLSLADEKLALVAHVQPRDWSPLSLRTPLHIAGAWSDPGITLEKGPLLQRVLPAALLAMLNPLAGLLPLMDIGQDAPAAKGCADTIARRAVTSASATRKPASP